MAGIGASARIELGDEEAPALRSARVALHGWLDRSSLERLATTLADLGDRGVERLTLDCSRVRHIEYGALSHLLEALMRFTTDTTGVTVSGLSPHLRDLFRAGGTRIGRRRPSSASRCRRSPDSVRNVSARHEPVLLDETLRWLAHGAGALPGRHARRRRPRRRPCSTPSPARACSAATAIRDALASSRSRLARFGDRVTIAHATFRELPAVRGGREALAGTLLDLGVSSRQIDDPARGMSFRWTARSTCAWIRRRGEPAARAARGRRRCDDVAAVLREHGDVRDARGTRARPRVGGAHQRTARRRVTWCAWSRARGGGRIRDAARAHCSGAAHPRERRSARSRGGAGLAADA